MRLLVTPIVTVAAEITPIVAILTFATLAFTTLALTALTIIVLTLATLTVVVLTVAAILAVALIRTIAAIIAARLERTRFGRFHQIGIPTLAQFDHRSARGGSLIRVAIVSVFAAILTVAPRLIPVAIAVVAVAVAVVALIVVTVAVAIAILLAAALIAVLLIAVLVAVLAAILAAALLTTLLRVVLLIALTLFLFGGHLAHRLAQQAGVMLGMLQEVFCSDAVIRQLRVTGEKLILLDDLLRRATHLAFGARAVEDAVDDVAEGARAVRL